MTSNVIFAIYANFRNKVQNKFCNFNVEYFAWIAAGYGKGLCKDANYARYPEPLWTTKFQFDEKSRESRVKNYIY